MPTTEWKNRLYCLALPFQAPRLERNPEIRVEGRPLSARGTLTRLLRKNHVLGASALLADGSDRALVTCSLTRPVRNVTASSLFRVASITKMATALAALLPLLWVGLWNNEFIYKGAAVMWFCLAWLYAAAWCHERGARKAVLALFLLFSASDAYGQLAGALKSFSWEQEARVRNRRSEWRGQLHQPGDARAAQFKGAPLLPELFRFN